MVSLVMGDVMGLAGRRRGKGEVFGEVLRKLVVFQWDERGVMLKKEE